MTNINLNQKFVLSHGVNRILEELGRGGMGVVYKAEDTKLDRIIVPMKRDRAKRIS